MPGRRAIVCLLVVLAGVLTATEAARAAVDTAAIARALRSDPLYVDPALDDLVTPGERARLRRALRARGDRTVVAVVPVVRGDRFDGQPSAFLAALQARANRPGIYVVYADYISAASTDPAQDERVRLAATVGSFEGDYDAPVAAKLTTFLDALDDPDVRARADRAEGVLDRPAATPTPAPEPPDGGFPAWLAVVLGAAALAFVAGVLGRRRLAGPAPDAPPLLPDRVFEHARRAEREELHDRARDEVVALAGAVDAARRPSDPGAVAAYERALDAAAAASKLLDRARRIVELAAVLVLVDDAREQLRAAADLGAGRRHRAGRRLCFFDPLHGRATKDGRWNEQRVQACTACARDMRAGRDPEVLREDGRPWFEGAGAIAATGLGHFAADLPARLARGDDP